MTTYRRETVALGDLVATAFDEAARFSTNPLEVSRLATHAVTHMLERSRTLTSTLLSPLTRFTRVAASDERLVTVFSKGMSS